MLAAARKSAFKSRYYLISGVSFAHQHEGFRTRAMTAHAGADVYIMHFGARC